MDARNARLSAAFRFYYRFLRPLLPIAVRQVLQRSRGTVNSEKWYEPSAFVRSLTQCLEEKNSVPIVHPWPDDADFALVLTHDVETAEGLQHVPTIAAIEEELGFRSSWNVVPHKYPVDMRLIEDLKSRGFEIGVHGFNHDGRLYFSQRTFQSRAPAINSAIHKYGAVGFRSPMVHRNLEWLQLLDIEYDSSCFDVDPFQAMPGGVGSIWPFVFGRFVELPYTLPQDHTLFIALGHRDTRVWTEKLQFIARHHGLALMLTHPDYLTSDHNLSLYRDFLSYVKSHGGFWHGLPRDVTDWWRDREDSNVLIDGHGQWKIEGPVNGRATPAAISVHDEALSIVRVAETMTRNALSLGGTRKSH